MAVCDRKAELAVKYGISTARLDLYEEAGILKPMIRDGVMLYPDLRVALIAKAEKLGFSLDEIGVLIAHTVKRSDVDDFGCVACQGNVLTGA